MLLDPVDHDRMWSAFGARGRGQYREIYFFDTPDRLWARRGVTLRARRRHGGVDDSTIRLRDTRPVVVRDTGRQARRLLVELDALPARSVWSASRRRRLCPAALTAVTEGHRPPSTLFSAAQLDLLAGMSSASLDAVEAHGPVDVVRRDIAGAVTGIGSDLARTLVLESWLLPDGTRLLEVSAKCRPADAVALAVRLTAFLADRDIGLTAPECTKTELALGHHSSRSSKRSSAAR